MKFPHFRRPQPSCWYCGSSSHTDAPCPQRVRDAYRFAVTGAQMYPPRPTAAVRVPDILWALRLLEDLMLVAAADLAALQGCGPTPAARGAELAGAAATIGEWARQIELEQQ